MNTDSECQQNHWLMVHIEREAKFGCELVFLTKYLDSMVIKGALDSRVSECCELWHLLKVRDALEAGNEKEMREWQGFPL